MKKTFGKADIPAVANELLRALGASSSATIVALSGELGAGKTTLTQALARELGIGENLVSPTFVIMKLYPIREGKWKQLVHIDAYRLDSHTELLRLGWDELVADPENLILIEWPEKVPEAIPDHARRISLSHRGENEREIEM